MQAPARELPPSIGRVLVDLRDELRTRGRLPPGETSFSLPRTHRFQRDSQRMMLAYYERFGPVYTVRLLHRRVVIMLGPEANHLVTVTGAENLSWRRGMFGEELIPLLGDGLITTDGPYHDRARRIMMPAFHHDRMRGAVAVMVQETERSLRSWRPGDVVDVYAWIRDLAMSIAMRALLGLDPHQGEKGHEAAEAFERALSFYDTETWLMMLRGPGSPWARMKASRRRLDLLLYREIAERRRAGADGEDILSMLIDARDEDGERFSDRELRDQITTLLFGGHDTSSSSLSFLLYELARNPPVMARLLAEQRRVLGGAAPTFEQLSGGLLPELDMALDETLRLYPPVWFGPRLAVKDFRFTGYTIPAGTHIVHSSWASHRMPEVFPDPDVFRPERFTPEARRALPKGAYIPFGGGQRICIGKRFGQLVVKTAATLLLQRFRCELPAGHTLRIDKVPTLSPHGGLPMLVRS